MTHMADEIQETPDVIENLLTEGSGAIDKAATAISGAEPSWISIVARGTSDHAAVYARYLLEAKLGLPVSLAAPSLVSIYETTTAWQDGAVIAISQSGQSPDLVRVVEEARSGGALTVTITNEPSSPLAASSDHVIDCHAGTERSVAATKSYVASLVAVTSLVERLVPTLDLQLERAPTLVRHAIEMAEQWIGTGHVVDAFASAHGSLIVGRGYNLATALEIALKLVETGGRFALGYSAADLEHGPLVLATRGTPVLVFESPGRMRPHVTSLIERITELGAIVWSVGSVDGLLAGRGHRSLVLPDRMTDELSPIPFVIPGQLLAEAVALHLGLDPDSPPGLDKVTLTL